MDTFEWVELPAEFTLINAPTGAKTPNYTGRSCGGTVTVKGIVLDWQHRDLLQDDVWVLYCSAYDCYSIRNVKSIRPLMSALHTHTSGKSWDNRHDKMVGTIYPGTDLRILSHDLRLRGSSSSKMERYYECTCLANDVTKWVCVNDLATGNTKSFSRLNGIRPTDVLIDSAVDTHLGMHNIYEGVTYLATDGRSVTYYRVTIDGLPYLLHRFVWEIMTGHRPTKDQEIHHINHNTADNRMINLELLDRRGVRNNSQSLHKLQTVRGNTVTSMYKGVSWDKTKNRWVSCINFAGQQYFLGRYASEVAAMRAYDEKAKELNDNYGAIFTLNSELHLLHSFIPS